MKRIYLLLAVLLALAIAIGWALSSSASPTENKSLTDAFKEHEDNTTVGGKPMYYYFYSDSCPACRAMEENTLSNQTVIDALEANFTYIQVNTDQNRKLAQGYRIFLVPTNVFAYPDGTEMGRVVTAITDPDDFLELLDVVLEFYAENS